MRPLARSALVLAVVALSMVPLSGLAASPADADLLTHQYRPLAGKKPVRLDRSYPGHVLLIVNTASKCGYTPQFEALEGLQAKYRAHGFAVLGFPSGDFKAQEFEDEKQIQEFCTLTYGVKFPMFQKVHVVGEQATPLYRKLAAVSGQAPQWNFHKYLIGRDGRFVAQWGSKVKPDDPQIVTAIEQALRAPAPKGR